MRVSIATMIQISSLLQDSSDGFDSDIVVQMNQISEEIETQTNYNSLSGFKNKNKKRSS